jgi:flagellar hook protein FlgE
MSSLFAALGVSVSGLDAQSQAIGNISDNLSNAQTTGFKSIGTQFEDLVTASSATNNSPGGVRASPLYQNDVQGNIASTSTTTNLAISGQGFFPIEAAVQTTSGTTQFTNAYYTRQGDFTLNKDGYMVNSSGYYLLGYTVAPDGTVNASTTSPIQISSLLDNPVPTSTVTYSANLPASAATGYTSTSSTIQVYDALGNTNQMSLTWTKTGTNSWSVGVDVANGLGTGVDYKTTVPVSFNSGTNIGTIQTVSSGSNYTVDPASTDAGVSFALTFPGAGTQTVDLNLGSYNQAAGVTQYANSNSIVSVASFQQNGLGEGSFSSIGINASGTVSINYSNGSTRQIYQIPIAQFNSPDNLQRISGGAYQATLSSGTPNLYSAGTNGAGTISSSSLEASNVDIATEFTQMIQSQQIYSANAKSVTTINQMLTTIIQAIQ